MSTNMKAQAPSRAEGNGSAPADERDQRRRRGSAKAQRPLRYRWGEYVAGLGTLLSPAAHHLADHLVLHWMQDDGSVGKVLPDGRVESVSFGTLADGMGYETRSEPTRAVRELREHGLLESTRTGIGPRHPNLYQAVLPETAGQDRTHTYHDLPAETETAGQDGTDDGTPHAQVQGVQRNSTKAKDEALERSDDSLTLSSGETESSSSPDPYPLDELAGTNGHAPDPRPCPGCGELIKPRRIKKWKQWAFEFWCERCAWLDEEEATP